MGMWTAVATGTALLAVGGALLLGHQGDRDLATSSTVELARATVPATAPDSRGRSIYDWPTGGAVPLVRGFDGPDVPWAAGHRGVDLELDDGAPVLAAADGVVAFAGRVVDRGVVSIDHDDGVRTTYEPVEAEVVRGQHVSRGDVVGRLAGRSHCAPTSCLHWGARLGKDDYIDPMALLRDEVVIRLLPGHGRP
ncbi:M23 family metallopeptidase [Georgenia sunbinii]|uniref:M23 family metallopeptidase n=1 Tax=Georgenia sunbinii TaxID=3117728 RepID=UPI002F262835